MQTYLKSKTQSFLNRYPKVFFCHVPKCAGVSLSNAIYDSLYPKLFKVTRFASSIDLKGSRISSELLGIDMMEARESQLITMLNNKHQKFATGHCRTRPEIVEKFGDEWDFVTILRDPVKRFVSEYVYNRYKQSDWLTHEDSIDAYLESERALISSTTYARFFSSYSSSSSVLNNEKDAIQSAVNNLKQYALVGTLEELAAWKHNFERNFNVQLKIQNKNSTPNDEESKKVYANEKVMAKIRDLVSVDDEIYRAFTDDSA
ncbi:hypothetical protein KUL152_13140 [Tenacibaculum sp. KUL152]|nr:hypothetical protein KUL152_13140 [Tenacibaculum sp. KUL152]